jgi:hypothetical protein
VHTSVPPLVENSQTSGPSASYTHRKPSGDSGEPVEPTARTALRSNRARGSASSLRAASRNAALVPNVVTPVASASAHRRSPAGEPSYRTTVASVSSTPTRKFHIIQPVVVNQKTRSSACASTCRCSCLRCSSRIPPCPWTIAFGRPVVPLEYRTHSGWSNGTRTGSSGARVSSSASHSGPRRTVCSTVGSACASSASFARWSKSRPPYR